MSWSQQYPNSFSATQQTQEVLKNTDNETKRLYQIMSEVFAANGHAHTGDGSDGAKIGTDGLASDAMLPSLADYSGEIKSLDIKTKGPVVDARAFEEPGQANRGIAIQLAIDYANENGIGKVFCPSGIWDIVSIDVPMGIAIEGATDAYYQEGSGYNNLTIFTVTGANSTTNLINLYGGNHIRNIAIVYLDQTYNSSTMIDTGNTFNVDTVGTAYAKGGYLENVCICGGTTILSSVENSDYLSIKRLSFSPNSIDASMRISNGYDLLRFSDVHCNVNVAAMFKNAGIIANVFSNDIISSIKSSGVFLELGRLDELQLNNCFSYGVAYPIVIKSIAGVSNGGITLNNFVSDAAYRVITCEVPVTNFGIQINGLKATFITSDDSAVFYFKNGSNGTRIQAVNIYVTASNTWHPCVFDSGATNNRVAVTNFNFFNPSSNIDNGTSNRYSEINGFSGSDGLLPINTIDNLDSSYYITKTNGKNSIQAFSVNVDINSGQNTKTQTFSYPGGSFKDTPIVIAVLGQDNVGSMPIAIIKVTAKTDSTFTLKWDSTTTALATGVWIVGVIAIGNR